jgi:pyruvate dehydrogenase E2 component (dihydrolipoamide acetyltransferase)
MFGIVEFNSIINQPCYPISRSHCGKTSSKKRQIVVGNTMMLSLACDHRTVDGATGALFLQTLKQYIENPVTMLA